jgi:prepilin-type N-terminal cleavage/methylation domain-containing protein
LGSGVNIDARIHGQVAEGYTLIELTVVIAIISVMLLAALPRFENLLFTDGLDTASRWIMVQVPALKDSALRHQKTYTLHASLESSTLWITDESMTEEALAAAAENGYRLPEGIRMTDIQYTETKIVSTGAAEISFYKKGYSDQAIIHLQNESDQQRSLLIGPFLSQVKLVDTYVRFEG